MHDDEVSIDLSTARTLIHRQFPLQGTDPHQLAGTLHDEADAMNELADHSPVPTPTCFGLGRPDASYPLPWTVQTWIPGRVATPTEYSDSAPFTEDLVRLIRALRTADTRGRSFNGGGRGGELPDHDDWLEYCFERSDGLLDVARLCSMWEGFRELPAGAEDVMSHGDLIPAKGPDPSQPSCGRGAPGRGSGRRRFRTRGSGIGSRRCLAPAGPAGTNRLQGRRGKQ